MADLLYLHDSYGTIYFSMNSIVSSRMVVIYISPQELKVFWKYAHWTRIDSRIAFSFISNGFGESLPESIPNKRKGSVSTYNAKFDQKII